MLLWSPQPAEVAHRPNPGDYWKRRMSAKSGSAWASPLFRWAGSKRKLLPELMAQVPASLTRYVEPFAGSGCLFFALRPEKAILGDINDELIYAYSVIRDHPRLVSRAVHRLRNEKRTYYRLRSQSPNALSPVDRAARFTYLNRHCFNGVYRINRAGCFNGGSVKSCVNCRGSSFTILMRRCSWFLLLASAAGPSRIGGRI